MSSRSGAPETPSPYPLHPFPYSNIEALTESTGDGYTIHGEFLFAEVIEVDDDAGDDELKSRNGRDLNPRTL